MCDETKSSANLIPLKDRIRAFHDCMVPALHLFPQDIAEKLTESGFFTAPASTKYHGAYEGGLFDHSYNVASACQICQIYFQCPALFHTQAYP